MSLIINCPRAQLLTDINTRFTREETNMSDMVHGFAFVTTFRVLNFTRRFGLAMPREVCSELIDAIRYGRMWYWQSPRGSVTPLRLFYSGRGKIGVVVFGRLHEPFTQMLNDNLPWQTVEENRMPKV